MDKKQQNAAQARLDEAQGVIKPNGFQKTNVMTLEGIIIDIIEVDAETLKMDGISKYKKLFVTDDNGADWTLRAVNEIADKLTGKETTFTIAAGTKEGKTDRIYIQSAK